MSITFIGARSGLKAEPFGSQSGHHPQPDRWHRTYFEKLSNGRRGAMVKSNNDGSTWASVVAAAAVAGTLGLLYLPLVIR